jgi:hypothetical protein
MSAFIKAASGLTMKPLLLANGVIDNNEIIYKVR